MFDRAAAGETAELLQQLIRNRCVNDGTPGSGDEERNAATLASFLDCPVELVHPPGHPTRVSLVARLEGTDADAPTLMLAGHTDVVPATASEWERDPFGGELVDGEIWGRGAVDMLNQTAAMAVAFRRLRQRGALRGSLVFAAVADEEAGGRLGMRHLLEDHAELVAADAALTEAGGAVTPTSGGVRLTAAVEEKGMATTRITVQGRAGHGSLPLGADNALVTAAEVVRRLESARPPTRLGETWREFVESTIDDAALRQTLLDEQRLWDALAELPEEHRVLAHACTHSTFAPTQIFGGPKSNVIPGSIDVVCDVRVIPGETVEDVRSFIEHTLAGLPVAVEVFRYDAPSATSTATELWSTLNGVVTSIYPDGALVPSLFTGGTDARHLRAHGVPTYGFGVLSRAMTAQRYWSYFHGSNERIDVDSLGLSVLGWEQTCVRFLS